MKRPWRWIVAFAAVAVLVYLAPLFAALASLNLLTVTNRSLAPMRLRVLADTKPLWAVDLRPGQSAKRFFRSDLSDFALVFICNGQREPPKYGGDGYFTVGMSQRVEVDFDSCSRVTFDQSQLLPWWR